MPTDWAKAKTEAKKLRDRYGITEPLVNLFDVAANEGFEIIYFRPNDETKDISGLLDRKHRTIFLNVDESAARQNFTLAHELAHHLLDHAPDEYGEYRRNSLYATEKPDKELEADYFAAELLMPEDLILKMKSKYSLTDEDVHALSKLFGVSPSAMRYRIRSLRREREAQ
jgi:Zn-dependent peptidase ImmA (M78 family)